MVKNKKLVAIVAVWAVAILIVAAGAINSGGIIQAFAARDVDKPGVIPDLPAGSEPDPTPGEIPVDAELPGNTAPGGSTDSGNTDGKTVSDPASLLVLVNKQNNLPADYVPVGMVIPDVPFPFSEDRPQKKLHPAAAAALEELFAAVKAEGLELYAISGYRSYATQQGIFAAKAAARGEEVANQTSARAGHSEHQTGLAMDVTNAKVNFALETSFGATTEGLWLAANAHRYGFIIRYQLGKDAVTGYSYEPWHLRYVGIEAAGEIFAAGVVFEEYLAGK